MRFLADQKNCKITGRTLWFEETRYLSYSGSTASFTFKGKNVKACLCSDCEKQEENMYAWIAVYIDKEREPSKRICLTEKEAEYTLYEAQEERMVTITIMKYSEAPMGMCGIKYIEIDSDELYAPPAVKERKIEIIGDSITCGYGVEAESEEIPFSTNTENPTKSYSMLTAQAFDADVALVSWSGNGLQSHYVEETAEKPDDKWLMQEVYQYTDLSGSARLLGEDSQDRFEKWDFANFVPDIILINLGTNDCSWCKDIQTRRDEFYKRYIDFIMQVRKANENVPILCMLGTMDQRVIKEVEKAVHAVDETLTDARVYFLSLPAQDAQNGYGADWHPSEITQKQTAEIVIAEIQKIMGWNAWL